MSKITGVQPAKKYLMINGKKVETDRYASLFSPYSGEEIAQIAMANKEQTEMAIVAAYESRHLMAKMPAYKRAEILEKVVSLLIEKADQAAEIITRESSKPIMFSKAEVARTVETYKFSAEEAKRIHGETIPFDAASGGVGRIGYTLREPIGVIGAITPFNFPMNLVAHKVGPAIAAGNTVVLKPASQTPLSALFIAELFEEAGLPPGVLNVITGPGSVVGEEIVRNDLVSMVTFTGSPEVGIGIRSRAGLKKTTLELGSNSALIIDKDTDVDQIIDRCIMGAFSNQGQVCISLQRIYAHEEVYEEFTEKFIQAAKQLKVGDPLAPDTYISSLISKGEADRVLGWIEETKTTNASIAAGGSLRNGVLEPTIIINAEHDLKVSCQEAFAPVVVVNKFSSIEDAIKHVNNSRFGLQAGIYTNNVKHALFASQELHVGGVIINDVPTYRVDQMPYGGVKESGTGREGIKYAVEEMTEMKLIVWNNN
ncbi:MULTISPECIES: aldehyde dehydrogenase family protein [Cytobacillus]|uniref:aldehyde dehydrogenase family protein n=1 Tax=Cytobacillus TaxID=2675230 RepID=UPI0001F45B95|nr:MULTISPECIES: aldehyde dehydrogenase family protein [Cytobacillus]EFV75144.1 aldehyde dehydrogenase [Bacillus sp. 2_A_57_CT2]MCM3403562.1 aldehyde dehydrogenase family protein [Cytobacillus oceanisediminis]MDK7667214.1 aldehyde dehydrogenase family protein [Cytobacillus oceanisediminis]QOK26710.1 aldehyde dehydrogenase family protein [Cytobacillus oceanisediminis]